MSELFSYGFENYEQELTKNEQEKKTNYINEFYVKIDGSKQVIFLDDSGVRYKEHGYFNRFTKASASYPCTKDIKGKCVHCDEFGKKPTLVTLMTVKDLTGYVNKKNERVGVGAKLLFKSKTDSSKRLQKERLEIAEQYAEKLWESKQDDLLAKGLDTIEKVVAHLVKQGGLLQNKKFKIERIGEKSERVGDTFRFAGPAKPTELDDTDKPFDYAEIIKVQDDNIVRNEVMLKFAAGSSKNDQQNAANDFSQGANKTYEQAPDFTADDIPF